MLSGMFQLEENNTISTYKDINDDIYTFKNYPISDNIRKNKKGNLELAFDLSGTSLLGSEFTTDPMKIVNSKYHLSVNLLGLHKDAYDQCKLNFNCTRYVNATVSEILNTQYKRAWSKINETNVNS